MNNTICDKKSPTAALSIQNNFGTVIDELDRLDAIIPVLKARLDPVLHCVEDTEGCNKEFQPTHECCKMADDILKIQRRLLSLGNSLDEIINRIEL